MNRQKLIILPKLCDCNGDPDKQWFIFYSCRNPQTGKMVRFRYYDGFTGLPVPGKTEHARQLIDLFSGRLRSGWTPFADDTQAIYNDQIDYKTVAEMYGSRRSGNNTIRMWISKFLEDIKPGIRDTSFTTYKSKFRIFVLWLEREKIAQNDISTFDNQLIGLFFKYIIDDRKLSRVSIKKYAELLTNAFDYFKDKKLILYNPVYDIPACNRINDQASRPIQRADIEAFKKEIQKDPELWLMVQFEFYCCMRPGKEIRLLQIKEIDFIAGTIYVSRDHAKNGHDRVVTIPKQFLLQLTGFYQLQQYDREYYIFGRGGHPGLVPIGKNKLGYKFRKIRKSLNMPLLYHLYSWKHTGIIEADDANIPHKDISKHASHTDMSTTDIYFRNKKVQVSTAIRDNYPNL
jgi:integrase